MAKCRLTHGVNLNALAAFWSDCMLTRRFGAARQPDGPGGQMTAL